MSGPISGPVGDGGVGPIGVEIRGDMGRLLSMVLIFGASYEPLVAVHGADLYEPL